jgi:hypothetical protein
MADLEVDSSANLPRPEAPSYCAGSVSPQPSDDLMSQEQTRARNWDSPKGSVMKSVAPWANASTIAALRRPAPRTRTARISLADGPGPGSSAVTILREGYRAARKPSQVRGPRDRSAGGEPMD